MRSRLTGILRRVPLALGTLALIFGNSSWSNAAAGDSLPQVQLNSDDLGPRSIEDLTAKVISRDYANAWQTMAQALEQNRSELLDGYFTGLAKENLAHLITEQKQTNVRVRYQDHGHKLDAVFYSPAGDAMQLRDQAQLEVDVMDGDKIIHSEQLNLQYVVLMTPGADRWLVRDLEVAPEGKP